MKKTIKYLIQKFGYRISRLENMNINYKDKLEKYNIINNLDLFYKAFHYVLKLDNNFNNFKITEHGEGFLLKFSNLEIYVESEEEFFIVNEVFVEREYDFKSIEKFIVIDVGANIGLSSLFFSTLDFVEKVYAFEPVSDTFKQAEYNFKLNHSIHKVKEIKNVGLGGITKTENFLFDKNFKGNVGIRGFKSPSYTKNSDAFEIQVKINDATEEITTILKENIQNKILLKIDCEGAEYEILENLYNSGILFKIDIILLEWHDENEDKIENLLKKSNFNIFPKKISKNTGMIYAFNVKN